MSAPLLRFSEFDNNWLTKSFGNTFTGLPNNTLSRAELSDEDGSVKNVHYGDVLIKYGAFLDAAEESIPFISSGEFAEKWKNAALQSGDVIIADTAEDTTAGKCTEIGKIEGDTIVAGLHTIPVHPRFEFAAGYLGYYMNSDAFHSQLLPLMQGTKVTSISKTYLSETSLRFPADLAEQGKIADLLRNLDCDITLQQRKRDKLVALKAACLDKMFPKNGSKVPELRFAGFPGDWEQRKLGELMDITSVKRIHQSDWTDEGIRFIRARDIVAKSKNEEITEPLFISEEKYNEYSAISGKVKIGDLLVTGVGTIGVPMLIDSEEPLYFKDGNVIWFKNEDTIEGRFFYYSFIGANIQNYIRETSGSGTVGTYTIDSGKKTPILLPQNRNEQSKIGLFFSNLDNLITLHQRKLEKLRQLKQAMLHKLFV